MRQVGTHVTERGEQLAHFVFAARRHLGGEVALGNCAGRPHSMVGRPGDGACNAHTQQGRQHHTHRQGAQQPQARRGEYFTPFGTGLQRGLGIDLLQFAQRFCRGDKSGFRLARIEHAQGVAGEFQRLGVGEVHARGDLQQFGLELDVLGFALLVGGIDLALLVHVDEGLVRNLDLVQILVAQGYLLGKRLDFRHAARGDHPRLGAPHAVEQHAQLPRLRHAGQQVGGDLVRPLVDAGHLHQRHHTQQGGEQHHRQKSRSQLDADAQIGNSHGSPFTLRLPKRHFDACQSVLLSTAYL
ncbi:hypothetical protein D3C71_1174190 [compost metagenome]